MLPSVSSISSLLSALASFKWHQMMQQLVNQMGAENDAKFLGEGATTSTAILNSLASTCN